MRMRESAAATVALLAALWSPLAAQRTRDRPTLIFTMSGAHIDGTGLWSIGDQPVTDLSAGGTGLTDHFILARSIKRTLGAAFSALGRTIAFDAFACVDAVVHGIAQPAEHDEVELRRRDHHLRREHPNLGVIGANRSGGGRGALDKNQLHAVAVLFKELGFLGHPERRELADLARPYHVDARRHGRSCVNQK